ncbi:c-type cytochrome [Wenzhouxiangella limi]|uniref:Cytochrome c4 n=1 Tax=Wenzhouxiangella limi TaxID=2707351 RepID=A0A845V797_9GAMM|nr:c-type cytochrome [Wenzhouxiangella limi]NDY95825.1 cytochrome c4 [Wenzhouxiangella limi]
MLRVWMMLLILAPAAVWAVGDPERGAELAEACAACHGQDGNSSVSDWPKIAGQHPDYAARQSRLIREQIRDVPEMYPMVMNLSDQDLQDIAAHYAEFDVEPGVADEELVERGQTLFQAGDLQAGIPSCSGCHGPAGDGIPGAHYPQLRGQHADYTADRLQRYRSGENYGDDDPYSHIMTAVARNLTDADIQALSSYIEGLYPARFAEGTSR